MIEMIEMLLALWVLPSLLTLALMLLMLFGAPRWRGNPWCTVSASRCWAGF